MEDGYQSLYAGTTWMKQNLKTNRFKIVSFIGPYQNIDEIHKPFFP